jgi:IS605 OrfB family transposase
MLLTQQNRLKLNRQEENALKAACRVSKNLFNVCLYQQRQYFFQERKYLRYEGAYQLCKENENYKMLATDVGQQTMKVVDRAFRSFFNLLKLRTRGQYEAKVRLPNYLPKDGFFPLIIPIRKRDWGKLPQKDWQFTVPMARRFRRHFGAITLTIPEHIRDKQIKEIRIVPKHQARYFEVAYVYEQSEEESPSVGEDAIGIDLGVDNLATCVTTQGKSFILDGKALKSKNQWFNKRNSRLQSIKDMQGIQGLTKQQASLYYKRSNQVKDYMNQAVRYLVNYCLAKGIGKVVVGYNPTIKQNVNLGTRNNQNFVQIPHHLFRIKLKSLCERNGLTYVEQEESYTSKASAIDGDPLPVYNADNPQTPKFSGKRVKRGLYRTASGKLVNADANGALNILRKHLSLSKAKENQFLQRISGCLIQPLRLDLKNLPLYES